MKNFTEFLLQQSPYYIGVLALVFIFIFFYGIAAIMDFISNFRKKKNR